MYENLKFNKEKFETALREKGISQIKVAEQMGITNDAFTKYKKGRLPKTGVLYALAQFFDKDMEWFLTEETAEGKIVARDYEDPQDENPGEITLEEMCEVLTKLMSSDNPRLRNWAMVQFQNAFGKYRPQTDGVKEGFARYAAVKKKMQ